MINENSGTFFTQHGKSFAPHTIKKNANVPFKDHLQFPILVDVLCRKENHHAILCSDFSDKMYLYFLESFVHYLTQDHTPTSLNNTELIYVDTENLICNEARQKMIEQDFQSLRETLDSAEKYLLIALSNAELLFREPRLSDEFLVKQFASLLTHPKCRFLILTNLKEYQQHDTFNRHFTFLSLQPPSEMDVLTILKQHRNELENFHHVLIPEELLSQAYALSERFLSTDDTLEKSLLLLDSSAARAGVSEHHENNNQIKPILTLNILMNVLSSWTQIPASHLQLNKFKLSEFILGMQQRIFGQDPAITLLGHEIQQAQAHLKQNAGPFCSLLFAGPAHCGKKTTALSFAEQFFKQLNVLYIAPSFSPSIQQFLDIKVQRCTDKHYLSLKEVIRHTPYAIIMLENIEQAPTSILDGLQEIFSTGLLHDENGNQFNFRQTTILLSTTLASNRLHEIAKAMSPEEEVSHLNLMQLVMNEQKNETAHAGSYHSAHDIVDDISQQIVEKLPIASYLHIIPFFPLSKLAIEKIVRLKLKLLGKMLDTRHGIELSYAPEVIRFLANEILSKQIADHSIDVDKALKQLYFSVEQAILNQVDNKNRPNQLFLQLNETGQLLRCDWLIMSTARQHAT